ncbi:MAG: c-type cytochrome [Saprospiraceae bacterium]
MNAHLTTISAVFLTIVFAVQAQTIGVPKDEALAKKSGCFKCHNDNKDAIGPSFNVIAAQYKDKLNASDALIKTVKHGGKGNWTEVSHGVPMPPYSGRLSDAQIKNLVDWVMGL